ncbi:MAG: PEP-CTERM/exosortase system-associated acyltransferase [Candidatus Thiodiazotropha sp.]|jgi:N-acyl amino acid synthase of PEP-CTERM/exosortase system
MKQYFQVERTEHPEKLMAMYYLRYQVFCEERGIIPKHLCPRQLEIDEYDDVSFHFAAYHNQDNKLTGTVRLVRSDALEQLPLGKRCHIDRDLLPIGIDYAKCAEISRLAVSKRIRRRASDGIYPQEKREEMGSSALFEKRAKFPEIILGMYKALYHETKLHGIEHWFAAMEPSLVKLLRRINIQFKEIGPEVDYYGPVKPYIASVSDIEWSIYTHSSELFDSFTSGLDSAYIPNFTRH